jgi:hypothetical protein
MFTQILAVLNTSFHLVVSAEPPLGTSYCFMVAQWNYLEGFFDHTQSHARDNEQRIGVWA